MPAIRSIFDLLRAKQDIESRYPEPLTVEQVAAFDREREPHNRLCERLAADAKRLAGEEQRDIERAILNWTAAQREFGEAEVRRILHSPQVSEKLTGMGAKPIGNTPAEFTTFITAERQKWAEVIKAANIEAQ